MYERRRSGRIPVRRATPFGNAAQRSCRLRFMLEELALPLGATRIGRGDDCDLAIEDPAISREHAVIEVEPDTITIRDLGSRNGTTVNGIPVDGEVTLVDGDRVGVGSQVFVVVIANALPPPGPTGKFRRCHACGEGCVGEAPCVVCGAAARPEPDLTTDGLMPPPDRESWWLELHVETLRRALAASRHDQAAEVFGRLREGLRARDRIEPAHLDSAASVGIELALATGAVAPLAWVLETLLGAEALPSTRMVDELSRAPEVVLYDAREHLDALVDRWRVRARSFDGEFADAYAALVALTGRVHAFGRSRHSPFA